MPMRNPRGRSIRSSARITPRVFEIGAPSAAQAGGSYLTFTLKFNNNDGHNLGRFRISLYDEQDESGA